MVYYSAVFEEDLQKIFIGLLTWKKFDLSLEFCHDYIDHIVLQCKNLDSQSYHAKTAYKSHKMYGDIMFIAIDAITILAGILYTIWIYFTTFILKK